MALFPPYSTSFIAGQVGSTPLPALITYTVPAGKVAIITCCTSHKDTAATAADFTFLIDPTGSGSYVNFWFDSEISTTKLQSGLWVGHLVVPDGGHMQASRSGATSHGFVTMSGYLLTV